jgi:hypothetical protein
MDGGVEAVDDTTARRALRRRGALLTLESTAVMIAATAIVLALP